MEYRCTQWITYKHEPIPKTKEHAFGAWGGDEYNHSRSCTNCGKVESGVHSWYGGTVVLAPTCNEPGVMVYLCGGCDMVLLEEIPMRTAHVYDNDCDADCNPCGATRSTQQPTPKALQAIGMPAADVQSRRILKRILMMMPVMQTATYVDTLPKRQTPMMERGRPTKMATGLFVRYVMWRALTKHIFLVRKQRKQNMKPVLHAVTFLHWYRNTSTLVGIPG